MYAIHYIGGAINVKKMPKKTSSRIRQTNQRQPHRRIP